MDAALMDVRGPDGKITRFPDGTPDAKINEVMASIYSAPDAETARKDRAYKMGGGARGGITNKLADTFTFGLADDVGGVGAALGNAIVAPFSSRVDFDPLGAFNREKANFQESIARAEREAPAASTIAGVTGFLGSMAGAVPRAGVRAAQTIGQLVRQGAKGGAIAGTLGGIGASDGDLGERAASAGIGAATGAGLGAAVPVGAKIVGAGVRQVARMTGRGPAVSPQMIADALMADGMTAQQAGRMVADAQSRGVPLALADVGENTRALFSSVGRQPGPSRTIVQDMAIGRQEGQVDRIAGAIGRDLGPVANPRKVSEQLIAQAKAAAAPLYAEAYAAPTPITDKLAGILTRIPRAAVDNAKRIAKIEGRDPMSLGVDFNEAGDVILVGKPSVETLDFIKRGLDDVVEKSRDKTTGKLVLDGEGRAVNNLLRDFVAEVDRVNPTYAKARAAYAGPVRASAALNKGGSFAKKTADDIAAETDGMTPFELDQYRLGVRSAMTRLLDTKTEGANKVAALTGTPAKRKALEKLFGGKSEFDRFIATLTDEGKAQQTYNAVATGSPTAPRLADDAATSDAGLLDAAANAAMTGVSGRPITALINAIRDTTRYGQGEAGKVTRAEIAAALAETDPAVMAAALRRIRIAGVNTRRSGRIERNVATIGGVGAGNVAGMTIGQLSNGKQ
jgi:hypothetical protein